MAKNASPVLSVRLSIEMHGTEAGNGPTRAAPIAAAIASTVHSGVMRALRLDRIAFRSVHNSIESPPLALLPFLLAEKGIRVRCSRIAFELRFREFRRTPFNG